jgi:hypothetical protein
VVDVTRAGRVVEVGPVERVVGDASGVGPAPDAQPTTEAVTTASTPPRSDARRRGR